MPGKNFHLTPLESRKQLLLVESELNRVQLLNELRDMSGEIHQFKKQVQAFGALVSLTSKLTATFSAIGDVFVQRDTEKNGKHSWFSTLVNGARTGAVVWGALRSHMESSSDS